MEELAIPSFEIGTQVMMVSHDGGTTEDMSRRNESDVVPRVSLEYLASGSLPPHPDGIMGALQSCTSNSCIVVPTQVALLPSKNPPAPQRVSKRMRVTPVPTNFMEMTDTESFPDQSKELPRKRPREDPGETDEEAAPSDSTTTTEVQDFCSNVNATPRFRVRIALSSSYKCRRCLLRITKNHLQIQPTDTHRAPWYHVTCARDSIGSSNPREMEGFSELSTHQQHILCELLTVKRLYVLSFERTKRVFCRGCAQRIMKGALRIAEHSIHQKKPDYTVYHHVKCITFPLGEIKRIQDVSGWNYIPTCSQREALLQQEERQNLIDKENQALDPNALVQVSFQGTILPPPHGLSASLLPFQVEGFSWMVHQELHVPEIRGGMLADEMGMGKTLQTITTILSNRPKLQWAKPGAKHPPAAPDLEDRHREEKLWNDSHEAWKSEMEKCNLHGELTSPQQRSIERARGGTLVICPIIALYQWREEIKKFTDANALTVCCYHGTNRAQEFPRELLCKYDIVLTTYQVVEADFRKMVSPNKVKCPNCGGSFRINKLKVHLKHFCGKKAQRTEAQARQCLKANSNSSDNQPSDDFAAMRTDASSPRDVASSDEESTDDEDQDPMQGIDLDKLMKDAMEGSRASVLHTVCWWRVVLDEAHMIKSRASQTAAAAFALTSIHRWCLSGTPLQNRVGELYSLIRFLRIDPMAHYFCRKDGCSCKSVHYRMMNGKCQDCGHGTIQHFSYFNKHVLNPIQRAGYQGDGRRAMMKLKCEVFDKSLIRRTKQSRAEDMNLPPRVVQIRTVRLHPIEEDFYNALYTQTKSSFDDYVAQGTLLNNYAHIFDLLTKMRQAVDHPYLIVYSKKNTGIFSAPNAPAVANGTIDCELCHEPPTDRVVSSCCGSAFCRSCVLDYMMPSVDNGGDEGQGGTRCPSCRAPFSIDLNQESCDVVDDSVLTVTQETGSDTAGMPSLKEMAHVSSGSILRRINLADFATSTKVEALVQELVQMRQQRPGSKALVFSQFVNMLDLVRWRLHSDPCLQDLGLGVKIIHGGMNVQSRDEALKSFREDHSVRVLLMSLKAGGVALNLTVANEAYLLDPWWNPAAEMQAIDRTHRLGQHRPIRAIRFIAEGTVEERVLQLQEKKRLVFDGTVGRDAASLKMLTADDMKALFA